MVTVLHFGRYWQRCFWCAQWGKCDPGFAPTLIKVDVIQGLLCETCLERYTPPQGEYLQQILGQQLSGYTREGMHLAEVVAQFAYPIYANPNLGFCYKCDGSWEGWLCPVCDFPVRQNIAYMQMLSLEDIMGYEPTGRDAEGREVYERADITQWHQYFRYMIGRSRRTSGCWYG
jgi:hypothetical protein